MTKENIIKAGQIARQVTEFIKPQIKKGDLLLDIAEKIEGKIKELGGTIAFPTNLSINEVAAHYTPSYNDEKKAKGLLKVDFGVHIDGYISDTAFSLDLENNEVNQNLIEASEAALEKALAKATSTTPLSEIGGAVKETMEKFGVNPIVNLSGHSMEQGNLHAGKTVPNYDNSDTTPFGIGLFAIEPFSTTGNGNIHDGTPGNIYVLTDTQTPRSTVARDAIRIILEKYGELPFASRWLIKEMGTKALIALKQLVERGNLHHFPQLIENDKAPVAQSEHTILIEEGSETVTTA